MEKKQGLIYLLKRFDVGIIGIVLLSGLGLVVPATSVLAAASSQPITIKMAWYMPPSTAVDKQGKEIAQKIAELSHGSIKVETFPGGSLLKETDIARGLQDNIVQLAIFGVHWWANQESATSFDAIPFMVPSSEKLLDALHGPVGKDIQTILGRHNALVVGWGFYGYTGDYINGRHPIMRPQDLKGLRMRSDGPLPAAFMQKFGAVATTIDSSEVYTALQRGTLDGATSGMSSFISRKWIEGSNCAYITAMKPAVTVYPTQANATWWKSLTPEQRDTISRAVAATEQDNLHAIDEEYQQDIKIAEQHGVQVYIPQGKVLDEWKSGARSLRDVYLKVAGADGQKILADIEPYTH